MLFLKLGMRNLFRNKKRTFLASLAIGIGLAALILADGFWLGMLENMKGNITDTFMGHGQVHHKEFLKTFDSEFLLEKPIETLEIIDGHKLIAYASPRAMSVAMVSSAGDAVNVQLFGINPKRERPISFLDERLLKGKYLENPNDILIGIKLADKLGVNLGDRIVVTLSQVGTGELSQELFRVKGVFGLGSKVMDKNTIFIHLHRAQKLMGIKNGFHEIAFRLKDASNVKNGKSFFKSLSRGANLAQSWRDLAPGIVSAINMSNQSKGIIAVILLSLVSLGIMNTLFMSIYERLFEFGVLRALGTRGKSLLMMILSEAGFLAILSIFVGVIISLIVGGYWYFYGLDYSGIEFAEITFTDKIYFIFTPDQYLIYPLGIFLFTIIVGIYPGIHVTKLTLAQALKKTM